MNKSKLNQILEDAMTNVNELLDIETSELYEPYESIIKMYNKELEDIGYYLKEENQVALAMMSFGKCQNMSIDAINQCEENLPRNQTCEIVITAEVKE